MRFCVINIFNWGKYRKNYFASFISQIKNSQSNTVLVNSRSYGKVMEKKMYLNLSNAPDFFAKPFKLNSSKVVTKSISCISLIIKFNLAT